MKFLHSIGMMMFYQFKMGVHAVFFLQFLNFMFNVFFFYYLYKIPQSTLIVNCNEINLFRIIGLIKRKPTYCVPELKIKIILIFFF